MQANVTQKKEILKALYTSNNSSVLWGLSELKRENQSSLHLRFNEYSHFDKKKSNFIEFKIN